MAGLSCKYDTEVAWDDVGNVALDPVEVKAARQLEMKFFKDMRVYDRVPRSHQKENGGKIVGVR